MKLKKLEKSKQNKPLIVRKTLTKTSTQPLLNQNISLGNNNPRTKITINKTLLWKEQDKIKKEKLVKQKIEYKKPKKEIVEYTKIKNTNNKPIEINSNHKLNGNKKQDTLKISSNINSNNNNEKKSSTTSPINTIYKKPSLINDKDNYRFLLHHVSKNLNKTFSNLYEANNRSYSSPTNSFNGN